MTEAAINAEIDRELEISQGSWGGNTFGAKSREGSYGDALRIATSTVLRKTLPDRLAIFLVTFSLCITLMWICFLAWVAIQLWQEW